MVSHLGIVNADLVGWSDGGQVARRLAFTHPELVRRFVVSGVGLGPTPEMLKLLADAATVANWWSPEARAEYARVSPRKRHSPPLVQRRRSGGPSILACLC